MTDKQVLTDAEIAEVYHHNTAIPSDGIARPSWWLVARAVEAAVIAKMTHRTTVNDLAQKVVEDAARAKHYVPEVEAREHTRHALFSARDRFAVHGLGGYVEWTNNHWPSLRPQTLRPRTVTLSDGTTVSRSGTMWAVVAPPPLLDGGYECVSPLHLARTPADARLLADLVERPTEEVPQTPPKPNAQWLGNNYVTRNGRKIGAVTQDGIWWTAYAFVGGEGFTEWSSEEPARAAVEESCAAWLRQFGER
jgi:hypothetical protein